MSENTPTAESQMQGLVLASFQKLEADGTLAKLVEEQVKSTMQGLVQSALREYSPFGKALKERIEAQALVNFDELNLPTYNSILIQAIEREYMGAARNSGVEKVAELVRSIVGSDDPMTIKLSQVIEAMREDYIDDGDFHKMTLDIDNHHDRLCWISLDPEQNKAKYSCGIRITLKREDASAPWKVTDVHVDGSLSDRGIRLGDGKSGAAAKLVSAYMRGSVFEIDCDEDCERLYFGNDD